jgi:hypothetical protein
MNDSGGLGLDMAVIAVDGGVAGHFPDDKAALKLLDIKRGKDLAHPVMRQCAVAKGTEPAQQRPFLSAKASDCCTSVSTLR